MARTVNVNEEIIVVSHGEEDTGKLAMLGANGKFHKSVIPEIESLQKQDVLWSGLIGTKTSTRVTNTIALNKSLENYAKMGVSFYATDGSFIKPQYREFSIAQFTDMINDNNVANYSLSCTWGLSTINDSSDIGKPSTYTSLTIGSEKSFVTEIRGIY